MLPGLKATLGGKEYVIPSLNARSVVEFSKTFGSGALDKPSAETVIMLGAKVLAAALARNYPEVTEDKLLDELSPIEIDQGASLAWEATRGGRKIEPGEGVSPMPTPDTSSGTSASASASLPA